MAHETKSEKPKPPRKPRLNPQDREARQGLMLVEKLQGKYIPEIAQQFNVSTSTVQEELREAQRKQLHTKAVAFITMNLMPKALAVFAAALDHGDKEIAIRVLEGVGVLGGKGQPGLLAIPLGGTSGDGEESYESWRLSVSRVKRGKSVEAGRKGGAAERVDGGGDVIDVEVLAQEGEERGGEGAGEGGVEEGGEG